jgi:hypothetical protein
LCSSTIRFAEGASFAAEAAFASGAAACDCAAAGFEAAAVAPSSRIASAVLDLELFDHARRRRGHFQHDLVGLQVHEVLVAADLFTGLLVPGDQCRVGDRLGQLRNFDFDTHT